MTGFSYRKFTELQVQGARERSQRQVEISQLACRMEHNEAKWKALIQKNDDNDIFVFNEAIKDVFSKGYAREVSPFMTARLAGVCSKEYRTIVAEKTYKQFHADHLAIINWMHQLADLEEKQKDEVKDDLKRKIECLRQEIREEKEKKIQELRATLEAKRQELFALKQHKLEEVQDKKRKDQETAVMEDLADRCEWIDIEDNYFTASKSVGGGGSEWVLCS
jgi:hypothetical protein